MNLDSQKSAQPCGCDEGADHKCAEFPKCANGRVQIRKFEHDLSDLAGLFPVPAPVEDDGARLKRLFDENTAWMNSETEKCGSRVFGNDAGERKGAPIFTGVLMYFPDALAAVARVSTAGNDQHNPGEPLHWARGKSTDQMDTANRHMVDHGTGYTKDADGGYHLAKAAWRILAELQLTIERERGL